MILMLIALIIGIGYISFKQKNSMLKPKKRINENAVKKDFFKKKKRRKKYIELESDIKDIKIQNLIELSDVILPDENEIAFVRSIRSRPSSQLIPKNAKNIFIFASRIQERFLIGLDVKGILIQDKIFEKEKEWITKYNSKKNNNHSKITIFIHNDNYYVISGSGNPSVNARNELYLIEQSKQKYKAILKMFEDV